MKLELSHNNQFKFGYDGTWFGERSNNSDQWTVSYGRCSRIPRDWRSECIETARLIRSSTPMKSYVLYSGGIDSEIVLQSFIFAGIEVQAAITRFRNDLNMQDVHYAIKFCEAHKVLCRLLDLDVEKFVESGEAFKAADRTKCVQPQLLHMMWAMDQVDGHPVLGSGECYLEPDVSGSEW